MSHRIVWVDLPVTDLDRAIRFYSAVLGMTVTKGAGPGFTFGLLPHGEGVSSGRAPTTRPRRPDRSST